MEEVNDNGRDLWAVRKHQLCCAPLMWLLQFAQLERFLWKICPFITLNYFWFCSIKSCSVN